MPLRIALSLSTKNKRPTLTYYANGCCSLLPIHLHRSGDGFRRMAVANDNVINNDDVNLAV